MAELNTTSEKSDNKTRSKRSAMRVDLTAMVDLAFLLITFFMLTTTMSKPKAMDVAMPVDDEPQPYAASRTMTICLGKNNLAVWYLGTAQKPLIAAKLTNYNRHGLRKAIVETGKQVRQTTGKNMMVVIKPSGGSVYENLVNTLDEMKITGMQQYAIADIAPEDIMVLKMKRAL